ncbi:MAG: hypothetical protein RL662_1561 [Bacteroidota bacterium]|jgi:acetyl esterase/lipase
MIKIRVKLFNICTVFIAVFCFIFLSSCNKVRFTSAIIRKGFTSDGRKTNEALGKYVPDSISCIQNQLYSGNTGVGNYMDIYFPSKVIDYKTALPTIVWVHGGAWVAGDKGEVANYCKLLASKGYTVVAINYSLAPEKNYPAPLSDLNDAFRYIIQHAQRLHIDIHQLFLAGDSAGSHIAVQFANMVNVPSYAQAVGIMPVIVSLQLKGLILYCGPYDTKRVNLEGDFGKFIKTVLWAYSGTEDFINNEYFATTSVVDYITDQFPPSFISVGNNDPLASQSKTLAQKLIVNKVVVDTLFFDDDYQPKLEHEYQFKLETDAAKQALERSIKFINERIKN